MSVKTRCVMRSTIVVGIVLTFLLAVQGCKKEKPTPQQSSTDQVEAAAQGTVQAAKETAQTAAAEVAVTAEQTTCPIMAGNPINKAIFVEYEGKKVYFCCKGCEEKFLADPAQYVAKLPQFQE